jgi:hypothetical protein
MNRNIKLILFVRAIAMLERIAAINLFCLLKLDLRKLYVVLT